MPISAPVPPDDLGATFAANLSRFARAKVGPVREVRVNVSRPLPIYSLERTQHGLEGAALAGWRFVVIAPHSNFWADVTAGEISEIYEGPAVANLLRAAAQAERAATEGEARLVVQPLVGGGAIWVHGNEDRLWAYSPDPADDEISPRELIENWERRRTLMVSGSTAALENQRGN